MALLASRKSPSVTKPKPDVEPPVGDSTPLPDEVQVPGTDVESAAKTAVDIIAAGGGTALLSNAALTGAGAVYIAAGAGAGYMLTGTPEGAVIGGLNPIVGNAGNLGAQAARELHKLLGGDGQWGTLSGTSLQLAGFGAGVITVVFGALAGIAFIPVVLLVAAVTSAIEDVNRLAFGQKGASNKFSEDVKAQKDIAIEGFKKLLPDTPEEDLNRYGWAYAVGWVNKLNYLSWAQWSKKPVGAGITSSNLSGLNAEHMKFGLDRGYWYAPTGDTSQPIMAVLPFSPEEFWALEEKTPLGRAAFANAIALGAASANVFQYVWCMQQPRGTFMHSDYDHAVYWGSRGWFEGTIGRDGTLAYNGLRYDWRAKDTNFVVGTVDGMHSGFVDPIPENTSAGVIEANQVLNQAVPVADEPAATTPPPDPVYVAPIATPTSLGGALFRRR